MKLGRRLYLRENYPCAKFGSYSSISDVIMTSSMFSSAAISKVLQMFVNQVYFVMKTLLVFLFDFLECYNVDYILMGK